MTYISIIIPYFNRENTIERCIKSIDLENNKNIEIIIVDDCSNKPLGAFDNSSISVMRLDSNMGPVGARSFGAMKAKYDYLLLLDSDDELLPGWYKLVCEVIEKQRGFDIYGLPNESYKNSQSFDILDSDDYWKWVPLESRSSDYMMIIKASSYSAVLMPKLRISEIWYVTELFEFGLKAHYSDISIFKYHQDAGNQLSKSNVWSFDTSDYNRQSLRYAIEAFKRNELKIKMFATKYHNAWFKRLFKESILSLSISNLACLFFGGRDENNESLNNRN